MRTVTGIIALTGLVLAAPVYSQTSKPAASKGVVNELTIKASDNTTYTGTMETVVVKGKVTGTFLVTKPIEIKGSVAGTSEKGVMKLEFPYHMTERNCTGTASMTLNVPAKPGPTTGTMEAIGCGRDPSQKLTGTVELVPVKK